MIDLSLVLFTLLIALLLRMEPLRRLRPLTTPLLFTAAAALAHLLTTTINLEPTFQRTTEVAQFKQHLLRFVGR